MTVIYIGGVKGVGKTFALREVFSYLLSSGTSYERAKVAEVMFKLLNDQRIVREYHELETMGPSIKKDIRLKAFKEILTSEKQNVIFGRHYSIPSVLEYEYGILLEIVKKFDYLVLLYDDLEVVLDRREKNFERTGLDLLTEEAFAKFYARMIGKELKIIKTNNEVSSKLIGFLKEVTENG